MLYRLVALLPPPLQPKAKAVAAALTPLVGVVIVGLLTGNWDDTALLGGITAVLAAVGVHQIPNFTINAPTVEENDPEALAVE